MKLPVSHLSERSVTLKFISLGYLATSALGWAWEKLWCELFNLFVCRVGKMFSHLPIFYIEVDLLVFWLFFFLKKIYYLCFLCFFLFFFLFVCFGIYLCLFSKGFHFFFFSISKNFFSQFLEIHVVRLGTFISGPFNGIFDWGTPFYCPTSTNVSVSYHIQKYSPLFSAGCTFMTGNVENQSEKEWRSPYIIILFLCIPGSRASPNHSSLNLLETMNIHLAPCWG